MLNIDRIPSEEEVNYYSMLKIFNDDYLLFRNALIDIGGSNLSEETILRIIEDIRFCDTDSKKQNYDKIADNIETLLDTGMNTIKQFKELHNRAEAYTNRLYRNNKGN